MHSILGTKSRRYRASAGSSAASSRRRSSIPSFRSTFTLTLQPGSPDGVISVYGQYFIKFKEKAFIP